MKILAVQESNYVTRGPHQQHHLFERLWEKGHEIRVIDYDIDWKGTGFSKRKVFHEQYKVIPSGITVIRPWMVRLPIISYISNWFSNGEEIHKQIKEWKPDVIVAFGILNADSALYFAKLYKIPFVYYWIDILHMLIPAKYVRWFGQHIEEEVLKLSDKVVVINQSMKNYIYDRTKVRAEVIGAGVDLGEFKPTNLNIRHDYGIKDDEILLFFMGWVYKFSGLEEVMRELPNYPKMKLMIMGDGEDYERIQKLKGELGLSDRVIMVGKKPYNQVPNYVNASDVCILPALGKEPIMKYIVPIKIYEYMALKKPIVSTRLQGIVEEFGEWNGILYVDEPKEVVSLAEKSLIAHKGIGLQGFRYISTRDWSIITNRFESLLKECISGLSKTI